MLVETTFEPLLPDQETYVQESDTIVENLIITEEGIQEVSMRGVCDSPDDIYGDGYCANCGYRISKH